MKRIQTTIFCVFVTTLLLQSLSLALHPETKASAPARLNPSAQYGSHEPGAEPHAAITAPATLKLFFWHGLVTTLDTLTFGHNENFCAAATSTEKPRKSCTYDARKSASQSPPGEQSSRRVHRAALTLARRFDAGWHPFSAKIGYWAGRLIFAWAATSLAIILTAFLWIQSMFRRRYT